MRIRIGASALLALALAACGGGDRRLDEPAPPPEPTPAPSAGVHPRFDPLAGDLPFNNDLVFANSTDGTAHVGTPSDAVRLALNQLDGFSTSAYFDLLLSGSVDPASVQAGRNVWLIPLDTGSADPLDLAHVVGVASGSVSYDVRVVSLDGGSHNAIRLRPTAPLKPRTKYLVALGDGLRTPAGERLQPSPSYRALRGSGALDAALQPVRVAVQAWENLAAGAIAAASGGALTPAQARDSLLQTHSFTTGDTTGPLLALGAPRATVVARQVAAGVAQGTAVANATALDGAGQLPSPAPRRLGISALTGIDFNNFSASLAANVGKLYTGFIELPYYLTAADAPGLGFGEYLSKPWRPDAALATAMGAALPADADGSFNLGWRFPYPQRTTTEKLPLQLTLPQANWVPGYAAAANCGQIYAATGYPTVVYVHGITSDRTSVVALAHTLASRCIATVAIDLPLHGVPANSAFVNALNTDRSQLISFGALYGADQPRERHFGVAGPTGAPAAMDFGTPGTDDGSGTQFINLAHLTVTRDHSKQAVADLLNLNASLGNLNTAAQLIDATGLDLNRVSVVGVSLGAILGSVFVTTNQQAIAADTALGLTSPLKPLRGLVASVGGAQVSQILAHSPTFSPVINQGLARVGVAPGSSAYERFLYTAQAALDSADPVNFMQPLSGLGVPVLLQQVNGDAVIPNAVEAAPLAGTQAMARLLDATPLGLGSAPLGRGYVRMTAGGHASLLRPEGGAPQVTAELQAQVVTFVLNNGDVSVGSAASGNVQTP